MIYKAFEPHAQVCAVFDASSVRYVHSSSTDTSSSGGESGNSSKGMADSSSFASDSGLASLHREEIEPVAIGEKEAFSTNDGAPLSHTGNSYDNEQQKP